MQTCQPSILPPFHASAFLRFQPFTFTHFHTTPKSTLNLSLRVQKVLPTTDSICLPMHSWHACVPARGSRC